MGSFTARLVFVSLLAVPVCYLFDWTSHSRHPTSLFLLAALLIGVVLPVLTYFLLFFNATRRTDPYCYVFTMFSFTSVVDLVLAITIHGKLTVLNFYLDEGEPYLQTGHGMFINYWDATFHYVCYLILVVQLHKATHLPLPEESGTRQVGLLWFGSIMNSLVVFLPGNVIGRFAEHVKPSYFLNCPFLLFPLTFLAQRIFRYTPCNTVDDDKRPQGKYAKRAQNVDAASEGSPSKFSDISAFGVVLTGTVTLFIFIGRGAILLAQHSHPWLNVEPYLLDTTQYPLLQMLTYAFYGTPFIVAVLMKWVQDDDVFSCRWVKDGSSLFLGAVLQGQFTHIGASLVNPPDAQMGSFVWRAVPQDGAHLFWLANLTPVVFGVMLWASCHVSSVRHTAKAKAQ